VEKMAQKVIYVSKSGNDSNDGLSVSTPKQSLGGAKAILQTGTDGNKIWVGIGTYAETVVWNTSDTYVELWGDYDGSVFGSAAGECIHEQGGNFDMTRMVKYNHMVIKETGNSATVLITNSVLDLTFDYCTFRPPSGNACRLINNSAVSRNITFNYCTQDTNHLSIGQVIATPKIVFNNYDNSTAAKYLGNLENFKMATFNNCSLIWSTGLNTMYAGNLYFNTCTVKLSSTGFLAYSGTQIADPAGRGSVLFKDCTLLDSSASSLDLTTFVTSITPVCSITSSTSFNIYISAGSDKHYNSYLFDNTNSDGKKILILANGTILDGDSESYSSTDVLYYHSACTSRGYHGIPIEGLAVSTEYGVTFYFKKAVNDTSSTYDVRMGILKGTQQAYADLYTTPANALTYADYAASAHTYDTWYSKTLTFTTTSDVNDTYHLIMYMNGTVQNFKITKPAVA
jgi:hypothetical protein